MRDIGDELEIQYFKEKEDNLGRSWELAAHDFDCRTNDELKKVEPDIMDGRSHRFVFE